MAKGTDISITWHAASGQFRKQIGKQIGRSGSPTAKVFYLGNDERAAKRKALALRAEWEALLEQGHVAWPNQRATTRMPHRSLNVVSVNASRLTVGDAIELFKEDVRRRAELGLVSNSYRNAVEYRFGWV